MFIPGCQWVEVEENCERFVASTKRKFLSLELIKRAYESNSLEKLRDFLTLESPELQTEAV